MQLEFYTLFKLGAQRRSVTALGTLVGQFCQIIRLEFYAVELFVTAQLLNFFLGFLLRQHHIAVFVARKLIEQLLLCDALTILGLGAETFGNSEIRHNRRMIDSVSLYFFQYGRRRLEGFGDVGK